jgi:hypothetical protein
VTIVAAGSEKAGDDPASMQSIWVAGLASRGIPSNGAVVMEDGGVGSWNDDRAQPQGSESGKEEVFRKLSIR